MFTKHRIQTYFFISCIFHVVILLVLILGYEFATPIPVIENTNKNDVISAVILGDTEKSKILPRELASAKPKTIKKAEVKPIPKVEPKPITPVKKVVQKAPEVKPEIKKDVIALKPIEKKKVVEKKVEPTVEKQEDLFAKDLLADIKKQSEEQKKVKQKALKSKFEKMLRDEAEKSLRQQLLNEEIKLKGTLSREAQGVVNKYQALIIQSISEHWIIPPAVDKKLYCDLSIRLAPGGIVLDVQIVKSSGDAALDRSARAAVFKSSPLPVPTDPEMFKPFKEFTLRAKPENVLSNSALNT